jgi:hypothetical protein
MEWFLAATHSREAIVYFLVSAVLFSIAYMVAFRKSSQKVGVWTNSLGEIGRVALVALFLAAGLAFFFFACKSVQLQHYFDEEKEPVIFLPPD